MKYQSSVRLHQKPRPGKRRLGALVAVVVALTGGCAGPTTPLGAPWAARADQTRNGPISILTTLFEKSPAVVQFDPPHQVLHGRSPIRFLVRDPDGIRPHYRLIVRHNGLDVSESFLRQAQISLLNPQTLSVQVSHIRLSPSRAHQIEVIYGSSPRNTYTAYARLDPPTCLAHAASEIERTLSFAPDPKILAMIREQASAHRYSSAFYAALVAQESGFDPSTVSWARAIGLTQITPVADAELRSRLRHWPRYPGLESIPAVALQYLVRSGAIHPGNDWRLDAQRNLEGGAQYLRWLETQWQEPGRSSRIDARFANPEETRTALVLASYHSGLSRVTDALQRLGPGWLDAHELLEARRYVNRIFSYCDHFSRPETSL